MFSFYGVSAKKNHPKIITGPINWFAIPQIYLHPLEYIIRLMRKLLVKLRFGDFQNFFKVLFTSKAFFTPKTTQKSSHISEKGAILAKFISMFNRYVKVFDKIVI